MALKVLGDGHREFQVIGVEDAFNFGAVKMDEPEHLVARLDRRTNDAGGADIRQTVAIAQVAVAGYVLGQNGFACAQNFVGQVLGNAGVRGSFSLATAVAQ